MYIVIQIFLAHGRDGRDGTGRDGTDQPKVVQEVLADLKKTEIGLSEVGGLA